MPVLKLTELENIYSYMTANAGDEFRTAYITAAVLTFILGTVIGSFLNVLIYRLPRGENFVKGRSRCTSCGNTLKPLDLIPVFSWIFLRGRCRYCREKISPRYIFIELLTGICYSLAFLELGVSWQFLIAAVLFSSLIILSVIDLSFSEIPYSCSITVAVLGVVNFAVSFFCPGFFGAYWYEHLIGAVIVSLPFAVLCYFGAMGGGDVQLVAAAGLLLGWAIVPSVFIAFITGAFYGIYVKTFKRSKKISFGPFLSLGIAAGALWGNRIMEWYLGLIS